MLSLTHFEWGVGALGGEAHCTVITWAPGLLQGLAWWPYSLTTPCYSHAGVYTACLATEKGEEGLLKHRPCSVLQGPEMCIWRQGQMSQWPLLVVEWGGGGGRIKVAGSQEDIGKWETSMGGDSYTTYYGSYIYNGSEISWRIILASWKSLVSKECSGVMKLKKIIFYSAFYSLPSVT